MRSKSTISKAMLRFWFSLLNFFCGGQMNGISGVAVLVLVCGLPAAGKTALVKHVVATGATPSRRYERVTFDDMFEHMVVEDAEFDPEKWKACQKEMVVRVTERLKEQNTSIRGSTTTQQLVLLVDDNFQYRSLRKRFFHLATELNCGFALLLVNVPAATCRERNASRNEGTQVPDEVFQRMVVAFEPPNGGQNPWEVNTCELNSADDGPNVEDLKGLVDTLVQQAEDELGERRLRQMERQKEESQQRRDRLATQRNVLHLVDLQLRRWISMRLQDENSLSRGETKAQVASQLNQRRKNYLASLKRSLNGIVGLLDNEDTKQVVVTLVLRFQQE